MEAGGGCETASSPVAGRRYGCVVFILEEMVGGTRIELVTLRV